MESLPNYDSWKLASPYDNEEEIHSCEECGADVGDDLISLKNRYSNLTFYVCEGCYEAFKKQAYDEAYSVWEEFQAEAQKGFDDMPEEGW